MHFTNYETTQVWHNKLWRTPRSHNTHNSNGRVKSRHVHAAGESTVVALIRPGHFFRVVKVADGLRRMGVQVNQLVTCDQLLMIFCFRKITQRFTSQNTVQAKGILSDCKALPQPGQTLRPSGMLWTVDPDKAFTCAEHTVTRFATAMRL